MARLSSTNENDPPKKAEATALTSIAAPLFAYLAALTTTVHADPINLPSTMLGSWCYKQGTETRQTYVRNAGVCLGTLGDVGIFIVWPDGYGSAVAMCTIIKVEQLAMNFYSVNSNCKGPGKYDGEAWARWSSGSGRAKPKNATPPLSSVPEVSPSSHEPFVRKYHIDMGEFEPVEYRSFAEFFDRRFRPGVANEALPISN
jgi:hypothetical protein